MSDSITITVRDGETVHEFTAARRTAQLWLRWAMHTAGASAVRAFARDIRTRFGWMDAK